MNSNSGRILFPGHTVCVACQLCSCWSRLFVDASKNEDFDSTAMEQENVGDVVTVRQIGVHDTSEHGLSPVVAGASADGQASGRSEEDHLGSCCNCEKCSHCISELAVCARGSAAQSWRFKLSGGDQRQPIERLRLDGTLIETAVPPVEFLVLLRVANDRVEVKKMIRTQYVSRNLKLPQLRAFSNHPAILIRGHGITGIVIRLLSSFRLATKRFSLQSDGNIPDRQRRRILRRAVLNCFDFLTQSVPQRQQLHMLSYFSGAHAPTLTGLPAHAVNIASIPKNFASSNCVHTR